MFFVGIRAQGEIRGSVMYHPQNLTLNEMLSPFSSSKLSVLWAMTDCGWQSLRSVVTPSSCIFGTVLSYLCSVGSCAKQRGHSSSVVIGLSSVGLHWPTEVLLVREMSLVLCCAEAFYSQLIESSISTRSKRAPASFCSKNSWSGANYVLFLPYVSRLPACSCTLPFSEQMVATYLLYTVW